MNPKTYKTIEIYRYYKREKSVDLKSSQILILNP